MNLRNPQFLFRYVRFGLARGLNVFIYEVLEFHAGEVNTL